MSAKIKELEAEIERLRKKVEVQGFNLRLREIDGSMDVDALIKDAERWRDFPRRLNAFWDNCRKESGGHYIVVSLPTLQKHLIDAARGGE